MSFMLTYELLLYDLPFMNYSLYINSYLPYSQPYLANSCANVVSYFIYELLLYDLPFLNYALSINHYLPYSQPHLAESCTNVVSYFIGTIWSVRLVYKPGIFKMHDLFRKG
ncbi:unnamed protein product [Schistosoma margrebowiei]|uniref:Uncharacterized protein n=1 Tax=Schistosoma margrebowiei TaxID=48269 RepID=A0A183MFI1_9TREM|nr:unnamed protein product [Schistosoma margrebowiei]